MDSSKLEKQREFLDNWPEVKEVIDEQGIKTIVTDLHYDEESMFMNKQNLSKFQTKNTPEPIFVGYSDEAKTPFMILRFIDAEHNKKEKLPDGATSFVVLTMGHIAHVGFEPIMSNYKWVIDEDTHKPSLIEETTMNLDGGTEITTYVIKLIKGEIEGVKLK